MAHFKCVRVSKHDKCSPLEDDDDDIKGARALEEDMRPCRAFLHARSYMYPGFFFREGS